MDVAAVVRVSPRVQVHISLHRRAAGAAAAAEDRKRIHSFVFPNGAILAHKYSFLPEAGGQKPFCQWVQSAWNLKMPDMKWWAGPLPLE